MTTDRTAPPDPIVWTPLPGSDGSSLFEYRLADGVVLFRERRDPQPLAYVVPDLDNPGRYRCELD